MFVKQLLVSACRSSKKAKDKLKSRFGSSESNDVIRTFKKSEKKDEITDPVVLEYILEQIESTKDPEKLEKISKILDELEKRELERQKKSVSELNTHPKILTETDVYRAVQSLVDTPEAKLIKSINLHLPIDTSIWKKSIKKRIHSIPTFEILRLLKSVFNLEQNKINVQADTSAENDDNIDNSDPLFDPFDIQETPPNQLPAEIQNMCTSIWNTVESELTRRLKQMSIEEIARMTKLYAHANRSNPTFFREIENELFERDMEYVPYRSIGMILEGFSHANLGSATLYGNLARTIKVAQAEIHPMELAKYAYYFSKTPENIAGGFGVYQMAEQKLDHVIELMEFNDLLRISRYFISQNIGSNLFLQKIERKLIETYPSKQYGGISPNQLTKIIKYTSKHYFQYNDKALFHTLEADAIKQLPFMTPHQIQTVLWSYSRSRRGNFQLYEIIEAALIKKIKMFNARSIAFAYYEFSYAHKGSIELFKRMEERILEIGIDQFSGHYLVKILSGMNMRNALEQLRESLLKPILNRMTKSSAHAKYSESIRFLYLLVELPTYEFENKENTDPINSDQSDDGSQEDMSLQEEYDRLFDELEKNKFGNVANQLKIDEVSQLYFAYRSANIGSKEFISILEKRLERQTDVPKAYFSRVFFSLTQHLKFDIALEFIPIVKELMQYGDIKFFFSHEDFIRLSWSLLLCEQAVKNGNSLDQSTYSLPRTFWLNEVYDAMFALNPNTLKFTTLPIWVQTVCMLTQMKIKAQQKKKFQSAKQSESLLHDLIEKVDSIEQDFKQEYVKRDLKQFSQVKKQVHESLEMRMKVFGDSLDYQLVQDLVDEFLNVLDSALYIKHEDVIAKIGVIILNHHHYSDRDTSRGHDGLLLQVQNKITLLQNLLDWEIIVIDEHVWNSLSEDQQQNYFFENVQLETEAENQSPKH